jgi:hypothetical protein
MDILGVYRITYLKNNMSQLKNYVSHDKYLKVKADVLDKKIHKDSIEHMFGDEFFTDASPLGVALQSAILGESVLVLPKDQGGNHSIRFEKIK